MSKLPIRNWQFRAEAMVVNLICRNIYCIISNGDGVLL